MPLNKETKTRIVAEEFELQLGYYVYLQTNNFVKGMKPLIPLAMGKIVLPLSFYKDVFGIK